MNAQQLISALHSLANPKAKEALSYFKIESKHALGIRTPELRKLAKQIGKNHELALELWQSEIFEARMLAALIAEPKKVTERLMEKWLKDFDNWGIVDCTCGELFDKTPFAYKKAIEWSTRKKEFEKRAAFSMMAILAVHDKKASDEKFLPFFPIIKREANDERNFVKKAVNWALRQIGKRNVKLNKLAIKTAKEIHQLDSSTAKWIASDALRELQSEAIQKRLAEKEKKKK